MANYTIQDIKNLREKTGAGMADVKKALTEADGNIEDALEIIRVKGLKSLSKREGRSAGAGLIAAKVTTVEDSEIGIMVEVNAETDFVVKTDKFINMADSVLEAAVKSNAADLESLMKASTAEGTVQDTIDALAAIIGEKLQVSKIMRVEGQKVASYLHKTSQDLPPAVGVLVATDEKAACIGRDVAMHIAAYTPQYLNREDIPAQEVEKERHTLEEVTRSEGKPEAAIAKIVEGRMNGFYKENVLLDQPYAKDPKISVGKLAEETGGKIQAFARMRAGE